MKRTNAREYLMQLFYQMEVQGDYSEEARLRFTELNIDEDDKKQLSFMKAVCDAFRENRQEIDSMIESHANGWKLGRISKTDLSVMRICLCESYYLGEDCTPEGAAINEAVKIAKKYGQEDSGRFVNGILGEISRSRQA